MVNLFFLHIHQESGDIYYHQTCQANHEGRRGPMGSIKNIDGILQKLKTELAEKKIKPIRCPNTHCNCGLCITKSSSLKVVDDFVRQLLPGMEVQI